MSREEVQTELGWFSADYLTDQEVVAVEYPGVRGVHYFPVADAAAMAAALQEAIR